MAFTRYLKYKLPMLKGEDVLKVQRRLLALNYQGIGAADGKFGNATDGAVRAFQQDRGFQIDGIIGPITWNALFNPIESPQVDKLETVLPKLTVFHGYQGSILWQLQQQGVEIENRGIERTSGAPETVTRIWDEFGDAINQSSEQFGVPAELIVATICTETKGDENAVREEPGYESDEATPNKVSPGLMQTLISTAIDVLDDPTLTRARLLEPETSIRAGTAYIAKRWKVTNFDPPKVACAYNAGSVYYNDNPDNRWKMRQYPIGSSEHADRFVKWFNDFYAILGPRDIRPKVTFFDRLMS